jgi:glyoxylate reductase
MKHKILVSGHLTDDILSLLAMDCDVRANGEDRPMGRAALLEAVAGADGFLSMITDAVDAELMDRAPRLRVVSNMAVGYNNIDVAAATERGIVVTNTPGILTEATAELAFALILASARRVVDLDRRTRAGEWTCWAPMLFLSREVSGKTLGVVGLGRIGRAVARRAKAFGMKVLYHNRARLDDSEERNLGVEYAEFDGLLKRADFVSMHVPLSGETRHLIGRRELGLMKPTAYLVNTSRGPVVDEAALVEALRAKRIEGAGLDVYENEPILAPGLTSLGNVVLMPHVGSATVETRMKMARMAAENLLAGLRGERPAHVVNPEAG